MMHDEIILSYLEELAEKLEILVRDENINIEESSSPGGLCRVEGKHVIILNSKSYSERKNSGYDQGAAWVWPYWYVCETSYPGIIGRKWGSVSMTPIESIYEIQSVVLDLQCYLQSKDKVVSYRAQERYEQWVNRFFRENKSFIKPEQWQFCSHDPAYFLRLME